MLLFYDRINIGDNMGDAINQEIENNSSNPNIYIVQEGDTLSDIAYRFGGDGTREVYEQFARDNNITDPDHIVPGQVIDLSKLPNYNGGGSSGGGTSGGGTSTGGGTSSGGGTSGGGGTSSGGSTSGGGGTSTGGGTSGSTDTKKEPTDKKTDTSEPPKNDDGSKNDSSDKKNDTDEPPENDDGSKKDSSDKPVTNNDDGSKKDSSNKPVTNNDDGSTGGGSSGGTSGTGYDFKYDDDAMNSDWKAVEEAGNAINEAVNNLMNDLSEFCSNLNTLNANLYATPDTTISSYYDEFSELIGQSYSEGINGLIYYACKNAEDVIQTAEDWNNTI